MALAECQVRVRNLVMGPGTQYKVLPGFNPFLRNVRADQGGSRAWNHGTWSGVEWADEVVVPIPLRVGRQGGTIASWLPLHQQLAAAFAAVGDSGEQVELRWVFGGSEYVMFGRPRLAEPRTEHIAVGKAATQCAFVAQDPRIYAGIESAAQTGLPTQTGGLAVPLVVPFTVDGVVAGGSAPMLNEGTTDTGLTLRIDGPVVNPVVAVQRPDGEVQSIRFDLTLADGQWLDISTATRTALLNGLPEANQRGRAVWDMDPFPLPGDPNGAGATSTLRFTAGDFNVTATLAARWRSAWW